MSGGEGGHGGAPDSGEDLDPADCEMWWGDGTGGFLVGGEVPLDPPGRQQAE